MLHWLVSNIDLKSSAQGISLERKIGSGTGK
jgi:hypothetical protein